MTIGQRLKEERLRLGMTQPQLSAVGDVQKGAQIGYENDKSSPTAAYLAAAAVKGIDVLYVITGRREPTAAAHTADNPHPRYARKAVTHSPAQPPHAGALQTGGLSGYPWGDLLAPADVSVSRPLRLPVIYQTGQTRREYQVIPRFRAAASAGQPSARKLVEDELTVDVAGVIAMDRAFMRAQLGSDRPDFVTVMVKGDSMERTLIDGETIIIDSAVTEVDGSGIYVVQVGRNLLVKRLVLRMDGGLLVKSDNPAYSVGDQEFTADQALAIRVKGRMVWPKFR